VRTNGVWTGGYAPDGLEVHWGGGSLSTPLIINKIMTFFPKHTPVWFNVTLVSVFLLIIVMLGLWVGNGITTNKTLQLSNWYEPPELTDVNGKETYTFKRGDAYVTVYHVERMPVRCWGLYIDALAGPVNYQSPPTYSQIMINRPTKATIRLYREVPKQFPLGDYKMAQIIYPTCDSGRPLPPLRKETGVVIHIVE
jgi:hypothetical protein